MKKEDLKLGLFGSFSKNSDIANSDIDILVKMEFKKEGNVSKFFSLNVKFSSQRHYSSNTFSTP